MKGEYEALNEVGAKTNTGSVKLSFDGKYFESLSVSGQSDVGEVHVDFAGTYEDSVDCKVNSSVGDVVVRLPKSHEIVIDAKTTEFTSNLEIKDMQYSKNKDRYTITGEESKITVDLSVTIGDAIVEYSN